jgi:hypothetical protein
LNQRVAVSNPAESDGFLRAIKIHSVTSFGGKSGTIRTEMGSTVGINDGCCMGRYEQYHPLAVTRQRTDCWQNILTQEDLRNRTMDRTVTEELHNVYSSPDITQSNQTEED